MNNWQMVTHINTLLLTSLMEIYGSPSGGCRRCNSTEPQGNEHNLTSKTYNSRDTCNEAL